MSSGAAVGEMVNSFLTLPGIAGFAVIDRQRPPYFCNLDGSLSLRDKTALFQALTQVFDSIPHQFQAIELHQENYQTHLYRIDEAALLLVMLHPTLDQMTYKQQILPDFLASLRHDRVELLALINRHQSPDLSPALPDPDPTLEQMLAAFNELLVLAVGYLGKIIVANQIRTTRPDHEWCLQFDIDQQVRLATSTATKTIILTSEQQRLFQQWACQLIRAIARVIRTFQEDVDQELSPTDRQLLLGPKILT
jgi:hypothetical protein